MSNFRVYVAIPLLPPMMVIWATFVLSHNPFSIYNSDTVHLFLLAQETISNPRYFFSWYLPGSNFIFPDVLLALVVAAGNLSPIWMPIAISAIQSTILVWTIAFLVAGTGRYELRNSIWAAAALFVGLTVTSLYCPLALGGSMTLLLASPYIRVGTIIAGLFAMRALTKASVTLSVPLLVAALLISAAAGYSDPFFLLWFALPCLGATFLIGMRGGKWFTFYVATSLAVAAATGITVDKITRSSPPEVPQILAFTAKQGFAVFYGAVLAGDIFTTAALAVTVTMVMRAIFLISKKSFDPKAITEILLAACCICSILTPVVTGVSWAPAHLRYSLPMFILPAIWIFLVAPKIHFSIAVIVLATLAVIASTSLGRSYEKLVASSQLGKCISDLGLRDGYSDYWNSKSTVFLSARSLHIAQLFENGSPRFINMSTRWFSERSDGNKFNPNFILPKGLKNDEIRTRFGTPSKVARCGDDEVWIYPTLPLVHIQ